MTAPVKGESAVRRVIRVAGCVLWPVLVAGPALAADPPLPQALEQWRGWVLDGEEYRTCPWLATPGARPAGQGTYRCAWPGRLVLELGARGGEFRQTWRIETDSWVALPGGAEQWPQDVRVDGRPAAVVARGGAPFVRLEPGDHLLAGRFDWPARPESLAVPAETGLIELGVDGARIDAPTRTGGALFLGARAGAAQAASFDFDVHRLLVDGIPARLVTRLTLRATGASRELLIGPVLPAGFVPIALDAPLPARVEADGRLRVQLRAGVFTVELTARAVAVPGPIAALAPDGSWPSEEIWSFAGDDRLRVAALEGGEGIDAAQADVPEDWREYPAMRMLAGTALAVVERSRGIASADDNRLRLQRTLWLDFDHAGYTAVDQITGTMRGGWRLDMAAPWRLGSAQLGGEPLLVTQGAAADSAGVELRAPQLALQTIARSDGARGALPATGWSTRFDDARGELQLPPGHRLVAALGVDSAPGAWLERWGLWNLFGVVIVAVFVGWLAGRAAGALAFVALALSYQEAPQMIWLWGNLLAALALARAAPEGRLRAFAQRYRTLSFVALALVLVPFMWGQLRLAIHPQLDAGISAGWMPLPAAPVPVAPPPPPPVVMPNMQAADVEFAESVPAPLREKSIAVTAMKRASAAPSSSRAERYAPGTVVQAGPGTPAWRYHGYAFAWSGPVEPGQAVRFVVAGPVWLAVWRLASVLLLAALFACLLAGGVPGVGPVAGKYLPPRLRAAFARGTARAAGPLVALLVLAMLGAAPAARAQWPDAGLLGELKTRLTKPAACEPSCAELLAARVRVDGARLTLELDASALARLAVPVPTASGAWLIDGVTVDGVTSATLRRTGDESLWVPLQPGVRTIAVSGRVAAGDALQLVFPWVPKRVAVSAPGWDVAGVSDGRVPGGSIDLTRRAVAGAATAGEGVERASSEFPPFVRVVRRFAIGTENRLETRVERIAPERAAFSLPVPLLDGESVLTADVEVRAGRSVLAAFATGAHTAAWSSSLPRAETLALTAPAADARYVEVWEFAVSPQWHAEFAGLPATLPETPGEEWVFEFRPRAGEQMSARFTRPVAVPGGSIAIDSVERELSFGARATDAVLNLRYRATQGGRHSLRLPAQVRVTAVSVDGETLALRPENGELSIPILPGEHTLQVTSTQPGGVSALVQPGPLDLGAAASNVRTTLALPADRWALFARGGGVGPAILYWSELVAFLLTAWFVGRSGRSPLRTHEWVLLGLGLSTLSWMVFALVAIWLFAMQWRRDWAGGTVRWRFNAVQVLLAALTFFAVTSLLFSGIRDGLLSTPDMGVTGPGSGGGNFSWFVDRIGGELPQPAVLSLPLWVYKTLVFAWAVWAAFAVLRWLRMAWHAWRSGGYWRQAGAATR